MATTPGEDVEVIDNNRSSWSYSSMRLSFLIVTGLYRDGSPFSLMKKIFFSFRPREDRPQQQPRPLPTVRQWGGYDKWLFPLVIRLYLVGSRVRAIFSSSILWISLEVGSGSLLVRRSTYTWMRIHKRVPSCIDFGA